jgi:Leucine-rich repeat (LRR) protein
VFEADLGSMGAKALSESKNLPNLETLVLIHNDVNEGVQALFKDNENFPKLKDVYFYKAKAEV